MNGDIDKLIKFIAKYFPFDEKTYPELKGANKEKHLIFAIRHSAIHFAKTAGKIAAVSEDADHNRKIKIGELKENTSKSLINTLRLAELLNMSEDDLISAIEKKFGKKMD